MTEKEKQTKQAHFPKFTFDDVLALQCCMKTVKKVQEDKELYERLNLIHSKIYDAYSSNTEKINKKPTDKIEPKFKVGDWVVRGDTIAQILDIQEQYYIGLDINGKDFVSSRFLKDDKIHLWTIQDAKDGDVLCCKSGWMCIFKAIDNHTNTFSSYCSMSNDKYFFSSGSENHTLDKNFIKVYNGDIYPATKKQRNLLFQKMKDAGYKWNDETNTLEKLIKPKFKVGDWVVSIRSGGTYQVEKIENYEYTLKNIVGSSLCLPFSNEELIRKWTIKDAKDGDVIQLGQVIAIFKKYIGEEKCICHCSFCKDIGFEIPIENGDDNVYGCHNATPAIRKYRDYLMKAMNDAGYEWDGEDKDFKKLVPNRFDPNTLKAFDKVIVRKAYVLYWSCDLFSYNYIDFNGDNKSVCIGDNYCYCIPYNDETKHLVGTTEEAPEYYRYWEK